MKKNSTNKLHSFKTPILWRGWERLFLLFLLLNSTLLFSQIPQWQWVRGGGSDLNCNSTGNIESCKWLGTDANGNIYGMSALGSGTSQIGTLNMNGYGYDDFAVFSYKCDGTFRWVRFYGCISNDIPTGITVDNLGNVYVSGEVGVGPYGDAHFGDTIIPTTLSMVKNVFIQKLDSNGHTKLLNFPGPTIMTSANGCNFVNMNVDNIGNQCVLATWEKATTNWNGFNIPSKGYYILKFDKNNLNLLNITKLDFNTTGSFGSWLLDFKIDNHNNYYLHNVFTDTIWIGGTVYKPDSIYSVYTELKNFVAKFDTAGNNTLKMVKTGNAQDSTYLWLTNFNIIDNSIYWGGNITNGGNLFGTIIHNTCSFPYYEGPCIAKLNATTGALIAVNHLNNCKYTVPNNPISDKNGNIILPGTLSNIIIMNTSDTIKLNNTNANSNCFFLANIDSNLSHFNWGIAAKITGGPSNTINTLVVDDKKNIFVGGSFTDSLYDSFGNGIRSNGGNTDFFIAKVSVTNNCNCNTAIPTTQVVSLVNNTLTVKGNATGILDSLYWFWGDGTSTKYITQNTNVSHTYQSAGSYTVCLRTYNYCGTQDSCTQVVITAINETELKEIKTYPNPVNKDLIIENPYYKPLNVYVYNSMGLLIYQKQYETQKITIDMSNYASGVYILKLNTDNGMLIRKIVKE